MKTIFSILALLLVLIASGSAQLVTVDFPITSNNTIVNSETLSVYNIPLAYNGETWPSLKGVRPDSMRLEWRATAIGDSILLDLATRFQFQGSGYTGYATKDSVKAAELDFWLFPRSTYAASDELAVKATARGAGNTLTGSNKFWLHVRQYYTLPARR